MDIQLKYKTLKGTIGELKKVLVAFSGGMDSTLLLRACVDELGNDNVVAFTGIAPTFPSEEIEEAKRIASDMGVSHVLLNTDILKDRRFTENTKERCYHCKKNLLRIAAGVAEERGMARIVEGTNFDDIRDFRPGNAAIREIGAVSPLFMAELTKDDIRKLSKTMWLPTHNKPPDACLATRIPYGISIGVELLKQIELSEKFIKSTGISHVRVRYHGNVARIEVMKNDLDTILKEKDKIINELKGYGFTYIALDLECYRTGSMNEG